MSGAADEASLDGGVRALLGARWGGDVEVAGREVLASRAAIVARLALAGRGAPATVVVKHVFAAEWGDAGRIDPEFSEEMAAHRFLAEIGAEEGLKPRLLAWDARGIMVFDDLGRDPSPRMRTFGELTPMLARAFARLHGRTAGREGDYLRLRASAGLPAPADDRRRYGGPAQARRRAAGAAHLLALARLRAEVDADALAAELADAVARVESPGPFPALIHDDVANARQTFEVGDELYLLDFEYARYAHALLDLCKPMLGKFEMEVETGLYVWSCPGFGPGLADAYRAALREMHGTTFDDDAWTPALAAALAASALALVGRLAELEPERRLAGTVAENVNGILYRLLQLLGDMPYPAARAFIARHLGIGG